VLDGWALRCALEALGRLDVIHSHSSKAGALARTFGRLPGAAQVYSPHGFFTMTEDAPFYVGLVERWLAPLTSRIIAVSAFEQAHAIELGITPRKISVIPNGIGPYRPITREEARRALAIPNDAFVVGFVGRLAAQKDPLSAVATIGAVDSSLNATLAIIGDGELAGEVEEAAGRLGNRRVALCGPREAKTLMSAFDCLLCTSRYEGMPLVFLEALNCGVPIVSYPVGGTEELVHDGLTGWVTGPSPAAAARAIERIARLTAAERQAVAEVCRKLAKQHSAAAMGDATLALYQEVVQTPL
jgi:glycosyltransferase involved in cell wall biosynthesis